MTSSSESHFSQDHQTHLQHLKLKGLQPKTILISIIAKPSSRAVLALAACAEKHTPAAPLSLLSHTAG